VDDRSSPYTNFALTMGRTDEGFRGRAGLLTVGGKRVTPIPQQAIWIGRQLV
jgi:hypothetical protein